MPALTFDKCCGCIDLKTGCFIIGYLNLVGIILYIILTALAVVAGVVVAEKDTENHDLGTAVAAVGGVLLIFMIIFLAFNIVLLVGLHKNKPGHVRAYLVYSAIFLVVSVIGFIVTCATGSSTAGGIIQQLISILIVIYFLLVIRSMYFQMKDPSRGPAIYSAA